MGLRRLILDLNQSPKCNTWSEIPVALLCMIKNLSERKQGSSTDGDKVLLNTGGLSFVLPELVEGLKRTD